jgi:hypothetical protein
MRLLLFMRQENDVRYFEPSLEVMAERGDHLHVVFPNQKQLPREGSFLDELAGRHPRVTYRAAPAAGSGDPWPIWGRELSAGLRYLFFRGPRFADSPKLRDRGARKGPRSLVQLAGRRPWRTPAGTRALTRILAGLERLTPPRPEVVELVRDFRPDLVAAVAHPRATDYVRAAKRLGIPTGLLVASWDNLTTKGLIHELPDFLTVWNEGQKREAVELHRVPPERVFVTGAQTFDHWFTWKPSTSREEFCRRVGLDPARPYLLWMCSSEFITGDREAEFVERWLAGLREHGPPALASVQVLVRPYPSTLGQWKRVQRAGRPGLAVWPLERQKPTSEEARAGFFDSVHHSEAVVGINTSALVESAIIGRPVYTYLAPEFRETQAGTPHFALISEFAGGMLEIGSSFEDHVDQLAAALEGNGTGEERRRRFVREFARPRGLEQPAAPILVAAIDRAIAQPDRRAPERAPLKAAARAALAPLVRLVARRAELARERETT